MGQVSPIDEAGVNGIQASPSSPPEFSLNATTGKTGIGEAERDELPRRSGTGRFSGSGTTVLRRLPQALTAAWRWSQTALGKRR
jgi:hypothetical protein